jgi:hypothetical protein
MQCNFGFNRWRVGHQFPRRLFTLSGFWLRKIGKLVEESMRQLALKQDSS